MIRLLVGLLMTVSVLLASAGAQAACPIGAPVVTDWVAHNFFQAFQPPPAVWVIDVLIVRGPNPFTTSAATIQVFSINGPGVTNVGSGFIPPALLSQYVDHAGCHVAIFATALEVDGTQQLNPDDVINPVWCATFTQPLCGLRGPEQSGVLIRDDGGIQGQINGVPVVSIPTGSLTSQVGFCPYTEC